MNLLNYAFVYVFALYMLHFLVCAVLKLTVNRSVFMAVDVSNQTSAPAKADTQVPSAPGG